MGGGAQKCGAASAEFLVQDVVDGCGSDVADHGGEEDEGDYDVGN